MTFETYVPRPGFSVRPSDLPSRVREEMRARAPAPMAAPPAPTRRRHPMVRRAAEIPMLVAGALVLAFLIKAFLLQAFYIPSGSMIPALEIGDRVLVEKLTYRFRDPQRGEIIVFERPGTTVDGGAGTAVRSFFEDLGLVGPPADVALIKRVLGLPGETVEVRKGTLMVDGRRLVEEGIVSDGRSFPPFTVPEDSYYLLGDNRGNSDDSRYSLGAIPREAVVGRAFVVLWPPANASLSLRTHYAGGNSTTADGHPAPVYSPPALPRSDNAPEASPP